MVVGLVKSLFGIADEAVGRRRGSPVATELTGRSEKRNGYVRPDCQHSESPLLNNNKWHHAIIAAAIVVARQP